MQESKLTLKQKLWIYRGCYVLFYAVIPLFVISCVYGLIGDVETTTSVKLTGAGIFVLMIASTKLIKKCIEVFNNIKNERTKSIIKLLLGIGLTILLVILLECAKERIDLLQNAILSCGFSMSVAFIFSGEISKIKEIIDKENRYSEFKENMDRYKEE